MRVTAPQPIKTNRQKKLQNRVVSVIHYRQQASVITYRKGQLQRNDIGALKANFLYSPQTFIHSWNINYGFEDSILLLWQYRRDT